MLSLSFAASGGILDREGLGYRGRAIYQIRQKMGSLDDAASEATIGAILLLAGVEVSTIHFHCPCRNQLKKITLIFAYPIGPLGDDIASPAAYESSPHASRHRQGEERVSNRRDQAGDLLVSVA